MNEVLPLKVKFRRYEPPEHGGWRLELGRLWIIRCSDKHEFKWMVVWRRRPGGVGNRYGRV